MKRHHIKSDPHLRSSTSELGLHSGWCNTEAVGLGCSLGVTS